MVQVFMCTGKKKVADAVEAVFRARASKGDLEILATTREAKSKLLRTYEHLRILVLAKGTSDIRPDQDLLQSLDHAVISSKAVITARMSSFKEADNWLKWNIKERTASYQMRGGHLDIEETSELDAANRRLRICHYGLTGPADLTYRYVQALIEDKMADPKTVSYTF